MLVNLIVKMVLLKRKEKQRNIGLLVLCDLVEKNGFRQKLDPVVVMEVPLTADVVPYPLTAIRNVPSSRKFKCNSFG